MRVIFGGADANNGNSTRLLLIMYEGLLNKIGLNDLKIFNGKKRKLLGTTYAKYLRLLHNFYNNTYTLLINTCTKMSPSWVCVVGIFDNIF